MLDYYRFKTIHDLFIKGKVEEARLELAELQRRYVALCDENTTFKMQLQEFEDILYLSRNLTFDGQFYWLETGRISQGPFCPHCYDAEGLLMRLAGDRHDRYCTSCRATFRQRVEEMAVAVPQELSREGGYIAVPDSKRKATVIPFRK